MEKETEGMPELTFAIRRWPSVVRDMYERPNRYVQSSTIIKHEAYATYVSILVSGSLHN
jgi:hypothetical protein